jgi:hypothetical protein
MVERAKEGCRLSRKIYLAKHKVAIVDDEDYPALVRYHWSVKQNSRGEWYALRNAGGRSIFMHREIMNAPDGMRVDHRNGNGLDNRSANLRMCTQVQNCQNRRKTTSPTTSKYKGVSRQRDRWRAQIRFAGQTRYLGLYDSEEMAARAYNLIAKIQFGDFSNLNEV